MLFYKYLRPERIDVLRDDRVRYTQPVMFNDPFESRPHVQGEPPEEVMERVSRIEAERMGMPDEVRRKILEFSKDPAHQNVVRDFMMAMFGTGVGILSLTEKCDNLLMWAHYAEEHTGLVIAFDTMHDYWNHFGKEEGEDYAGLLRKVEYSDRRPTIAHLAAMSRVDTYFTQEPRVGVRSRVAQTGRTPLGECGAGSGPEQYHAASAVGAPL